MIKKIGQNDLHFLFGHFPVLGKMKQTIEENVRERKKKAKMLGEPRNVRKNKNKQMRKIMLNSIKSLLHLY